MKIEKRKSNGHEFLELQTEEFCNELVVNDKFVDFFEQIHDRKNEELKNKFQDVIISAIELNKEIEKFVNENISKIELLHNELDSKTASEISAMRRYFELKLHFINNNQNLVIIPLEIIIFISIILQFVLWRA